MRVDGATASAPRASRGQRFGVLLACAMVAGLVALAAPAAAEEPSPRAATRPDFGRAVLDVDSELAALAQRAASGPLADGARLDSAVEHLRQVDAWVRQRHRDILARAAREGWSEAIANRARTHAERHHRLAGELLERLEEVRADVADSSPDAKARIDDVRGLIAGHRHAAPVKVLSSQRPGFARQFVAADRVPFDETEPPEEGTPVMAAPVPGDLQPTIDVQITPAITALATSLGNDPKRIFEFVRDRLEYEPYYGSVKGSQATLDQQGGNAYDLSSLLLALLRAAGIPARYVEGYVDAPVAEVMNWLGVDDPDTAGNLLATALAPTPVTVIVNGMSQPVSVRFEHIWVEAWMPFTNYRGADYDGSGTVWVPLDPSIKPYDLLPGIDIPEELGFDADAFLDDYVTTFHAESPVEKLKSELQAYVATNHPGLMLEDVLRTHRPKAQAIGALPGAVAGDVFVRNAHYSALPAPRRQTVRFHLYDGGTNLIDYTTSLPQIASSRITLSYEAATPADQAVIDSYGDLYSTPPSLVQLVPVLRIDGADVARGGSGITMGESHTSDMTFTEPRGVETLSNSITVGVYQGIGINTGSIPPNALLPDENGGTPDADGTTGDKLHRTALVYLDMVDRANIDVARAMQIEFANYTAEAIVENQTVVTFSFGEPETIEWVGLGVDADRKIIGGPFPVQGDDPAEARDFMMLTGANGSVSENRVFEDLYGEEAISTIKILELASDLGVPLFDIDSSNAGTLIPQLTQPQSVKNSVQAAVNQGHQVLIPRDPITHGHWTGTGWRDLDPGGAGGYLISGGQSGGATVDSWTSFWLWIFSIWRDIDSIEATITYPAADGDAFPYQGFWNYFFFGPNLRFDVTYVIHYSNGSNRTVNETFDPHFRYPVGEYRFFAGWGTGATRDFAIYDVFLKRIADTWVPEKDNTIGVEAEIRPSSVQGKFRFTLYDVSKEKGECLNKGTETTNDLRFEAQGGFSISGTDNSVAETSADSNTKTVQVTSKDYGGWGRIKVEAKVQVHDWLRGHIEENDEDHETVPRDDNDNHIADGGFNTWDGTHVDDSEEDGAKDDDDTPTADGDNGDGYSLYEEYRGFRVRGTHRRLDPKKKDMFVHDEDGISVGYYTDSDLILHMIDAVEFDGTASRVVNFNRGNKSRVAQHGLYLDDSGYSASLFGVADGSGPGPPRLTNVVRVYTQSIRSAWGTNTSRTVADGADPRKISHTTGHELGHGTSVFHHGDGSAPDPTPYSGAACVMRYFRPDGTDTQAIPTAYCTSTAGCASGRGDCKHRFDTRDY